MTVSSCPFGLPLFLKIGGILITINMHNFIKLNLKLEQRSLPLVISVVEISTLVL